MERLEKDRVSYEACPLCGSQDFPVIGVADCSQHPMYNPAISPDMTWCECTACNHVFTSGHFTDESLKVIFSKTQENQLIGYDLEAQRMVSSKMIDKVLPYAKEGFWLDIGFGNAALLFAAEEYGFTPVGVDLRKDNVDVLSQIGIEVYCQDVMEFDHAGRYSIVSMMDVLEHMPYPVPVLRKVHEMLADDGVLFLSMPNADSMAWKITSDNEINPYWGEIEHYHNFGRKRLYALLAACGFEPVRYGVSERYRMCMEVIARKRN